MADTELDTFLGGAGEPAPEPQQEPAPEPTPEPEEQEEPEEGAPEPEEAPPEPTKDGRTVPLAVLEKQRKDHKERAARLEGELAELRRQFDESKRVAQQPSPQQYQPPPQPQQFIPNPAEDPQGFIQWQQHQLLNERLNISQAAAQRQFGAEVVAIAANEFKQRMIKEPGLEAQLHQQLDPYHWVLEEVQKEKPEGWLEQQGDIARMRREFETDPAAYRAKLRAELEAELAARGDAPLPPPVSPAAGRAPSLANVRSAAPRASGAWAGPTPLQELFPGG